MKKYNSVIIGHVKSITEDIKTGNKGMLVLLTTVALSIFREGSEIVILTYSIIATNTVSLLNSIIGISVGVFLGTLCGFLIYTGLIKIHVKYIFKVSAILLAFFCAGLASQAAGLVTSIGLVDILFTQVWDTSSLLSNHSIYGKLANNILGYTAKPNQLQLIAYITTLGAILISSNTKTTKK